MINLLILDYVVHTVTVVIYRVITGYQAKLPILLSTCHYDKTDERKTTDMDSLLDSRGDAARGDVR